MKISTKGRYAARAMVELAANHGVRCVPAGEIAEHQGVSPKYLETLLATLRSAGLIRSERGKNGGYALAKPPAEINLFDVLSCLEDSLDFVHCTEDVSRCERAEVCVTREVWMELKVTTDRILKRTYLDDLAERRMILDEERARALHTGAETVS
jgi:Rrf2 family protein